jgi:hypothetical protein
MQIFARSHARSIPGDRELWISPDAAMARGRTGIPRCSMTLDIFRATAALRACCTPSSIVVMRNARRQ